MNYLAVTVRLVLTLMTVTLLFGCAASGPKFSGLQEPAAGRASVYVYRVERLFAAAQGFAVEVDNRSAGDLYNASYLLLNLEPGKHVVTVKTGVLMPSFSRELIIEAGKTYFLEFDMNAGPLANVFFVGSELVPQSAEKASLDLMKLKAAK